jgi:hypothetical protein
MSGSVPSLDEDLGLGDEDGFEEDEGWRDEFEFKKKMNEFAIFLISFKNINRYIVGDNIYLSMCR